MIYNRRNYPLNSKPTPKKESLGWKVFTVVGWIVLIIVGFMWSAYNSQNVLPHWPHYKAPTPPISVPAECKKGWVECDLG